jgi:23S rRNA pseudouridine1911/1915/1917 synthase
MVVERVERLRFEGQPAERLDKFLASRLPDSSRSRLQSLIKEGLVLVDGIPAHKSGQMLDRPAAVEVHFPQAEPSSLVPEDIPLDLIFENDDLLVINKPAGMVVHPAAGHASGTLVHAALGYAPDIEGVGGEKRPGVVHRLDKDTSGLILLAKNDIAHRWLQDQFRLRKVVKVYLALVDGSPPTPDGRIEASVGRNTQQRKRMAVVSEAKGRSATSEYHTLEKFPQHTLLEVKPVTGRTHQIRLHLAFIGCPVVGDTIYGHHKSSLPLKRHFLHAWRLTIRLPGESEARRFEAPLPEELLRVLDQLRTEASDTGH